MFINPQITDDIFYVGVNDRQKHKFENMLALPHGVSYNAYLIIDEKTALVDTVEVSFGEQFIDKIHSQLDGKSLDYLIINHMEPDHSGSIQLIRQYFPDITLVGNSKTLGMLEGFYGLKTNTLGICDEEIFSLGKHQLQFFLTPMVHWPETMMTYDLNDKVLFSGDAFGAFGTLDGGVLDTDMNIDRYWDEMIRYYANIVGKYASPVQKALKRLSNLEVNVICSTHGPVWKEYVKDTVEMYNQLSLHKSKEGVVIVYGSMYGYTELMAETIAQGLSKAGIKDIIIHNVSKTDSSFILRDIYKYRGLIIGSPTYCNDLYPEVASLLQKLQIRGLKNRVYACFGSYTWAGASVSKLTDFGKAMKWSMVDVSVEEKQGLKDIHYKACLSLGEQLAALVRSPIDFDSTCG
jgi:anaerobic nitric oxide reductase flavorubredoxin